MTQLGKDDGQLAAVMYGVYQGLGQQLPGRKNKLPTPQVNGDGARQSCVIYGGDEILLLLRKPLPVQADLVLGGQARPFSIQGFSLALRQEEGFALQHMSE